MYCSGFASFHSDKREDGDYGTTINDDIHCSISIDPYTAYKQQFKGLKLL